MKRLIAKPINVKDVDDYMYDTNLNDEDMEYVNFKQYFNQNNTYHDLDVDDMWWDYQNNFVPYQGKGNYKAFLDRELGLDKEKEMSLYEDDYYDDDYYDDYSVRKEDVHHLHEIEQELDEYYDNEDYDNFWKLWDYYSDFYKDVNGFRPHVNDRYPNLP